MSKKAQKTGEFLAFVYDFLGKQGKPRTVSQAFCGDMNKFGNIIINKHAFLEFWVSPGFP